MKIIGWLSVLLLTASLGQATVLTSSDNFNDGVRNKAFWSVDKTGATLLESGGHLYGYGVGALPEDSWREATWHMKSVEWVVPPMQVEVEGQYRFPVDGSLPTNKFVQMMIGWTSVGTYSNRTAAAVIYNYHDGRRLAIYLRESGSSPLTYAQPAMPEFGSRCWLKLRYNSATGIASLRFKAAAADPWTLIHTINMNTFWKVPAGSQLLLRPFVRFQSVSSYYNSPGLFFLDNFTTRLINP